VGPLGRKVNAVISYDSCVIEPEMAEAWFAMAADVESRFYHHVSRYTTSAFMRLKLGDALSRRAVAPHIFETPHEARAFVASRTEPA
jgi:propionate CoA-transferase